MSKEKKSTSLILDRELYSKFKAVAICRNMGVGEFMEEAMREAIDKAGVCITRKK